MLPALGRLLPRHPWRFITAWLLLVTAGFLVSGAGALTALLGEWNWWAPPPLRRPHARLALHEAADRCQILDASRSS